MDAVAHYQKLVAHFSNVEGVSAGQLFGKACLKVEGKAFVAQHRETLVFKLTSPQHGEALALPGACLWDPSGKGRPMKEWVAVPAAEYKRFKALAAAAHDYVASVS